MAKAVLSSNGKLKIPKRFMDDLGLASGSVVMIVEKKDTNILEIHPMKKSIAEIFDIGIIGGLMTNEDIDNAIAQAVIKNNIK